MFSWLHFNSIALNRVKELGDVGPKTILPITKVSLVLHPYQSEISQSTFNDKNQSVTGRGDLAEGYQPISSVTLRR